jgi:parallel beta-helix repeat protein
MQGERFSDKPVQFKFRAGDIKPAWADDPNAEAIAFEKWTDFRQHIRAVLVQSNVVRLSGNAAPHTHEAGARYFIENTADSLDAPGEWHLDRKMGVVRYWPHPGEDLAKAEVVAPRLHQMFVLRGDLAANKPVRHVVLRGLTFSFTDWELPEEGYTDSQAAVHIRGDLQAEAAVDCAIVDCRFMHLGGYAIEFGRGCQRNRVVGSEISDIGAGGVRLGETANKNPAPFDANHGHVITDNHLHALGRVYSPAVGVLVLQSGTNRIAHNHIHDLYYSAVSVGWNWGYQETPCRENRIEFNHLHDIGQFMLSDMGAVYTLGIQRGTIVRNNRIHDVNSFTYGGWGLYTDEGSSDIVMENNVVYRCKSAGFHQHYGRENIVRNNIFAFNKEHQLMRSREEEHLSFVFTNNIVYFDSGDLLGSTWQNDRFVVERNAYWDTRLTGKTQALRFAGVTLDQWRRRGHDTNSLIADPLFQAPDKFDFRLNSNSPAFKLGFKPVDLGAVGPRPKSRRDAR